MVCLFNILSKKEYNVYKCIFKHELLFCINFIKKLFIFLFTCAWITTILINEAKTTASFCVLFYQSLFHGMSYLVKSKFSLLHSNVKFTQIVYSSSAWPMIFCNISSSGCSNFRIYLFWPFNLCWMWWSMILHLKSKCRIKFKKLTKLLPEQMLIMLIKFSFVLLKFWMDYEFEVKMNCNLEYFRWSSIWSIEFCPIFIFKSFRIKNNLIKKYKEF